jgi:hypothetical protein
MKKTIAEQLGVTKFPFEIKDNNGNEAYWEDQEGYWIKSTYDNNGNRIYWENSDGDWVKYTYDDNGNKTYCEDSGGYWAKYTFDDNGNETYWETSEGCYHGIKPSPLGGKEKEIEIEGVKYILTIKQ